MENEPVKTVILPCGPTVRPGDKIVITGPAIVKTSGTAHYKKLEDGSIIELMEDEAAINN